MPDPEPMGSGERSRECPECKGDCIVIRTRFSPKGEIVTRKVCCPFCNGTGTIPVQHDGEGEER